jgi:hypothetical protein
VRRALRTGLRRVAFLTVLRAARFTPRPARLTALRAPRLTPRAARLAGRAARLFVLETRRPADLRIVPIVLLPSLCKTRGIASNAWLMFLTILSVIVCFFMRLSSLYLPVCTPEGSYGSWRKRDSILRFSVLPLFLRHTGTAIRVPVILEKMSLNSGRKLYERGQQFRFCPLLVPKLSLRNGVFHVAAGGSAKDLAG